MSVKQDAKTTNTTKGSMISDDIIIVSKAPWYKEASGTVAVVGWAVVLLLLAYAIVANVQLEQWYWLLAIVVISLTAGSIRTGSTRVELDKVTL